MDLAELLPHLPHAWINTYPVRTAPGQTPPDCFWTSLNFFNITPDDRYFDPAAKTQAFQHNYVRASTADQFGDLIVYADEQGQTLHACVHIAGDVVFTKNGALPSHPWRFARRAEVDALYGETPGVKTLIFRLRELAAR